MNSDNGIVYRGRRRAEWRTSGMPTIVYLGLLLLDLAPPEAWVMSRSERAMFPRSELKITAPQFGQLAPRV